MDPMFHHMVIIGKTSWMPAATVIVPCWYRTTEEKNMIETIIWLAVGAFIGWNFPQPQFAKNLQTKLLSLFSKPQQ